VRVGERGAERLELGGDGLAGQRPLGALPGDAGLLCRIFKSTRAPAFMAAWRGLMEMTTLTKRERGSSPGEKLRELR